MLISSELIMSKYVAMNLLTISSPDNSNSLLLKEIFIGVHITGIKTMSFGYTIAHMYTRVYIILTQNSIKALHFTQE